uniref:Uncharacterized protein n=1 Tax=Romanomermis culicivorax TaxID=13658 RepID=A0A915HWY3_ROMCU
MEYPNGEHELDRGNIQKREKNKKDGILIMDLSMTFTTKEDYLENQEEEQYEKNYEISSDVEE